jgi:hypothetical protein
MSPNHVHVYPFKKKKKVPRFRSGTKNVLACSSTDYTVTAARGSLFAWLYNIKVPYLNQIDVCGNGQFAPCPLRPKQEALFTMTVEALDAYPRVRKAHPAFPEALRDTG